ncbi:unnamed protein product [Urochloa humidicola]
MELDAPPPDPARRKELASDPLACAGTVVVASFAWTHRLRFSRPHSPWELRRGRSRRTQRPSRQRPGPRWRRRPPTQICLGARPGTPLRQPWGRREQGPPRAGLHHRREEARMEEGRAAVEGPLRWC